MIAVRPATPAEIHRETLDGAAGGGPGGGELRLVRFPGSGVVLLVPNAPAGRVVSWWPQPSGPWWRRIRRWMRSFQRTDALAAVLDDLGQRRRSPLFRVAAAGLTRWSAIATGSKLDLGCYIEFAVPDDPPWSDAAVAFLQRWVDAFGASCWAGPGDAAPAPSLVDALCETPTTLTGPDVAARCAAMQEILATAPPAGPTAAPFPNLLRSTWAPPRSAQAAEAWDAMLDARLAFLERSVDPRHYPALQALLAHDDFAREFVGESDPARAHGRALVGADTIRRLHALGGRLEARHPVLAVDPFADLDPPAGG
jgi:hypothetical protein